MPSHHASIMSYKKTDQMCVIVDAEQVADVCQLCLGTLQVSTRVVWLGHYLHTYRPQVEVPSSEL